MADINVRSGLFCILRRMTFLKRLIPKPIKDALAARFFHIRHKRIAYDPFKYPAGINLFGFFSTSLGLGQGARLYARALEASHIPNTLLDVRLSSDIPYNNEEFRSRYVSAPVYGINVVHINPDMLPLLHAITPGSHWDYRYNIGVWLWELEKLPKVWCEQLSAFDEIWVPSRFIGEAVSRDTSLPVHLVPYGIAAPVDPTINRETLGLPAKGFLVLCMFDLHSYTSRKNPAAAVRAFFEAFREDYDNAYMVLKVHHASATDIAALKKLTNNSDNVLIINKEMDRKEVNSMIRCCDTLISLHRSEGFGLVMAEAMYLGVPVVATNWSANVDFMNASNACMVDYTLISTDGSYMYEHKDQRWAEPDVGQAARYLRRLADDPQYRKEIARAGMESIRLDFSIARCAHTMKERYDDISSHAIEDRKEQ